MAKSASLPIIALTTGEPAGVGPDIAVEVARDYRAARLILLGDRGLLETRARQLGIHTRFGDFVFDRQRSSGGQIIEVLHVPLCAPTRAGVLDFANSPYVLALLDQAIAGCRRCQFHAMVTAPVHKGAICESGVVFAGHTEYLAERTGTEHVVMMLIGGGMRVALATTHLPLREVPGALTQELLGRTLKTLCQGLVQRLGIDKPRILVAGLNPHAGESGHLGREEIEIIEPVLRQLRAAGYRLTGPLPADTLFQRQLLEQCDCVLAMYHDQGLTTLKHASFGRGVNVTLGLPIIRTSVDHGTALELAGSGKADAGSMREAVDVAVNMASRMYPAMHIPSAQAGAA